MKRIAHGRSYLGAALACCVMTALLAGCSPGSSAPTSTPKSVFVATATQWSSEHPGATYTTIVSLAPDTGKVRWQHREEWSPYHGYVGQPVVVRGVVYMVGDTNTTSTDAAHQPSGILLALRADDGQQLWRTEIGALASVPVVDGDTIYVSAEHQAGKSGFSKAIYALNGRDGSVRWKSEIPNTRTVIDRLMLSQGRLFLAASQICFDSCDAAYLFALDASSGHVLWQRSFEGNVTIQQPMVDDGVVYASVSGYGAGFFALSAADGHQLWQASPGISLASGGALYTTTVIGPLNPQRPDLEKFDVVALDGQTGVARWRTPTDIFPAVLAVDGSRVVVRSEVSNPQASQTASPYLDVIQAFRASDGSPLWRARQDAYGTSVASSGGTLYLVLPSTRVDGQPQVAALRAADGTVLWRQPVGPAHPRESSGLHDFGEIAPTGSLFCVISAGILYGIRTTDGHTLWSVDLSGSGVIEGVTITA